MDQIVRKPRAEGLESVESVLGLDRRGSSGNSSLSEGSSSALDMMIILYRDGLSAHMGVNGRKFKKFSRHQKAS